MDETMMIGDLGETIGDLGDMTIGDLGGRSVSVVRSMDGRVWVVQGVMSIAEASAILGELVDGGPRRMTVVVSVESPVERDGCGG